MVLNNWSEKMGQINSLMIDIQNDLIDNFLSFAQIAQKHKVPLNWVNSAWDMLCEQEADAAGYGRNQLDHDDTYAVTVRDSWYDDQYELDVEN